MHNLNKGILALKRWMSGDHQTHITLEKGVIIGGKYKIVEEIGRGGMGQVFKAYQLSLERPVAIKVLNPSLAHQEPDSIKRFHREAKLISSLGQHPHILDIYDFGVEQLQGLRYRRRID